MLPLFVYGSLRKGWRNAWSRRLWRNGDDLGTARVRGRLVWPGRYPTWMPAQRPGQWVSGELVVPASRSVLASIDGYEDSEVYVRRRIRVRRDNGDTLWAWIYVIIF